MKVSLINFFNTNSKSKNTVSPVQFANPTSAKNISFQSKMDVVETGKFAFLNFENIHCPCCGRVMVPSKIHDSVLNENVLAGPGKKALNVISKFERNMHPIEKKCFLMMKEISEKHPSKTLQELLMVLRPESLRHLTKRQFTVFNRMEIFGEKLSPSSKAELAELISDAKTIIINDSPENLFRRKKFIANILEFYNLIPEKNIGKQIYETSHELKTSRNDVNSFIVKFSVREPVRIGRRMVPYSNVEHIKPEALGGTSQGLNYLVECSLDNNEKGSMPLSEWLELHPEMINNTKMYLKDIIKLINKGKVSGYESYPVEVAKTLHRESKGKIDLEQWARSELKVQPSVDIQPLIDKFSKTGQMVSQLNK